MTGVHAEHLGACLALSCAEVSPKAWRRLVEAFGSEEGVLSASGPKLEMIPGISGQARARITSAKEYLNRTQETLDRLSTLGVEAVCFDDPRYPALLKQIADPPGLLYVRGDLVEQDRFGIAIVGSRKPRPYGLQMARKLASDLARAGLTVVSGGALGIDAAAHEGALRAGGRTIAVLGCGVDVIYPSDHRELYQRIATQGAVLSEFPLGAVPDQWRFPRRNRIISGLSRGVLVCDAPEDSGSLITATCAADQNRDVFAVPGNADTGHNRGAHKLLKEGAKLVESAQDVLDEYGLDSGARGGAPDTGVPSASQLPPVDVTDEEMKILSLLDLEPLALDLIIEKTGMGVADVSGLLTFLEMKRLVKRVAGPAFVRVLR